VVTLGITVLAGAVLAGFAVRERPETIAVERAVWSDEYERCLGLSPREWPL
jgi:hypothetical protein